MRYITHKGDNLEIMRLMDEQVDMIYLDPPFNTGKELVGHSGAKFNDTWNDVVDEEGIKQMLEDYPRIHHLLQSLGSITDAAYLKFMGLRLLECHRLLKDTGSIFLHCDGKMAHSLKIMLDIIFGKHNFRNNIVWCYKSGGCGARTFAKKHDDIFYYSKSKEHVMNTIKEKVYCDIKKIPNPNGKGIASNMSFGEDDKGIYVMLYPKDYWNIGVLSSNPKSERMGYPTQKPLELLRKIIEYSTKEGDLILDPFMGSGTTIEAGVILNRRVIGIDLNQEGLDCVTERMNNHFGTEPKGSNTPEG